jgi:hypothetical protein
MDLKNNTGGPRYVNTDKGAVLLQPGEGLPEGHTVSDADMAAIEATNFLGSRPDDASQIMDPAIGNRTSEVAAALNLGNLGQTEAGPAGEVTAQQLVDDNTEAELREIAETEGADISSAKNKGEIADAIIANRAE